MASGLRVFLLLVAFSLPSSHGLDRTEINDLRTSHVEGAMGRFLVSRAMMENVLKKKTGDHLVELASTVMERDYDTETFTEILVFVGNTTETTPLDSSSQGASLVVFLPVIAPDGFHFSFLLDYITDAPAPLKAPQVTSIKAVSYIDSIAYFDNNVVILRDAEEGGITVTIDRADNCEDDPGTEQDFDDILGRHLHVTNYPLDFDWGCDRYDFAFCHSEGYTEYSQRLTNAGGNVCTTIGTGSSARCPAAMEIVAIRGSLGKKMPYLERIVKEQGRSLEAEWIVRDHTNGLVFPCIG